MPGEPRQQVVGREVASLIEAAKAGDGGALGRLAEIYREYLLRIASDELGGDLRAKIGASDVVQETLLGFHGMIGQLRGNSDAELRAYLRQVLLNRIANAGRRFRQAGKRDIAQEISLDDETADGVRRQFVDRAPTPRTSAAANEENARMRQALARLPDDYRMVIELRDIQDRPWEEVGAALGRTGDAARQLWYRAINELRVIWEQMDGDRSRQQRE